MTRKKRKKPVQQKNIHEFVTKGTLTSPTTQVTMKIINQKDTPQHRSPRDSNDTSKASCTLQIDKGMVTKELILYPSYSIYFCQGDNLEQEPMNEDNTDTKDPDRFNPQQNTDDNRNIQYEKRNGKAFLLAPTG